MVGGIYNSDATSKNYSYVSNTTFKFGGKFYLSDTVKMDYKAFKEEFRSKCAIQLSGGTGAAKLDLPDTVTVGGVDVVDPMRYLINRSYNSTSLAPNATNFPTQTTMTELGGVQFPVMIFNTPNGIFAYAYTFIVPNYQHRFSVSDGTFSDGPDGKIIHIEEFILGVKVKDAINSNDYQMPTANEMISVLPAQSCVMEFKYKDTSKAALYISQLIINPTTYNEPYMYYNQPQTYSNLPSPPNFPITTAGEFYGLYPGVQKSYDNGSTRSIGANTGLQPFLTAATALGVSVGFVKTFPILTCGLLATNPFRDDWTQGEVK
jgi:hypothetical protein